MTSSPLFRPRTSVVDTFNTNLWDLRLVANDDDPWSFQSSQGIGGPSTVLTLRRTLTVHGKDDLGNDFVFQDPVQYLNLQNINLLVPTGLAGESLHPRGRAVRLRQVRGESWHRALHHASDSRLLRSRRRRSRPR